VPLFSVHNGRSLGRWLRGAGWAASRGVRGWAAACLLGRSEANRLRAESTRTRPRGDQDRPVSPAGVPARAACVTAVGGGGDHRRLPGWGPAPYQRGGQPAGGCRRVGRPARASGWRCHREAYEGAESGTRGGGSYLLSGFTQAGGHPGVWPLHRRQRAEARPVEVTPRPDPARRKPDFSTSQGGTGGQVGHRGQPCRGQRSMATRSVQHPHRHLADQAAGQEATRRILTTSQEPQDPAWSAAELAEWVLQRYTATE